MWKTTPAPFDIDFLEKGPAAKELYQGYFNEFREENNMYNFLLGWNAFDWEMKNHPEIYK